MDNKNPEKIRILNAETGKIEEVGKVIKSDAEWQKILTPEQFRIMRKKGTEAPDRGACAFTRKQGFYKCAGCGTDLFKTEAKFESGTGWPSFIQAVSELNIRLEPDNSLGMQRTEVSCSRCGAHLGHVFDDGPAPTGKRYCINSVALKFVPLDKKETQIATFGAGCFWGVESSFSQLKGVVDTTVGYSGGNLKNPTYEVVCSGESGHTEVVQIEFDPKVISYEELLDVFWNIHDPGIEQKTQYKSVIFYHNPQQEKEARQSKEKASKKEAGISTEILPATEFWNAEDYHQQFYKRRGIVPSCAVNNKKKF